MNYETPGVYVEEISAGPRPVAMSPTADTGFVAVLSIPKEFHLGDRQGYRSLIPAASSADAKGSWARELAFRSLLPAPTGPASIMLGGVERTADEAEKLLGKVDASKKEKFIVGSSDGDVEFKDAKEVVKHLQEKSSTGEVKVQRLNKNGAKDKLTPFDVEVVRPEDKPTSLSDLVKETLGTGWSASGSLQGDQIVIRLKNDEDVHLDVSVPQSMLIWTGGEKGWVLANKDMHGKALANIAGAAVAEGVGAATQYSDPQQELKPDIFRSIQESLLAEVPVLTSLDAFFAWQDEFADLLYISIASALTGQKKSHIRSAWKSPDAAKLRGAWTSWVKKNTGMRRLQIAITGFFGNGGGTAYIAVALSAEGSAPMGKKEVLQSAFDGFSRVAMLAAPGLSRDWQQAILEYAGPRNKGGRGDLFAILETPRFLLTQPASDELLERLSKRRWLERVQPGEDPNFEVQTLETISAPEINELRFRGLTDTVLSECVPRDEVGHGAAYGPWLIVDNPFASGIDDRYTVAPPSGFIAGLIAATDGKPGGGVHKAPANEQLMGVQGLVVDVNDKEQGPLNVRSINMVRKRLNAGIRVWGARTIASDPLWKYINVRRLFLMVERSIADAIQWAVFLPNNDATRGDLKATIVGFLYRLYMAGALEGASADEAFSVRCDRDNNPDVDVRAGILTVDIELRPVFPAEFIRLRFRQSPMKLDVS